MHQKFFEWPFHQTLFFPEGIIGFECFCRFSLFANQEELPFLWLESEENPQLAFIVIDPFLVCREYNPSITKHTLRRLGIRKQNTLFILTIACIKESQISLNLAAPLLIQWEEKRGHQILLHEEPAAFKKEFL